MCDYSGRGRAINHAIWLVCDPNNCMKAICGQCPMTFVSVRVCLPDFSKTCGPISRKLFMVHRGHRQTWTEKTSRKFRPLMCKNWENVAKRPIWESPHAPRALDCAMACGPRASLPAGRLDTGQSRAGLGASPVGVQFSSTTSRPAFGRVNTSNNIILLLAS